MLATEDGTALPFVDGGGDAREEGTSAWVLTFDTAPLDGLPAELQLHLSFELRGIPMHEAPEPMAEPADRRGDSGVAVVLEPIETIPYGPFAFDFTAPVSQSAP